ncbi:MAG TPA: DUF1275 family protein, partial [Flavobacterium sp.]|nr:DUF1275 family protein [Flavobacterium sp.]
THLTGLVTDIGIALGRVLLRKGNKVLTWQSLILNFSIITAFIFGALVSAYLTLTYNEYALLIPIVLLLSILIYDFQAIEKGMKRMKRFKKRLHI